MSTEPKLAVAPPEPDLAETCRAISEALQRLLHSGLKRETVVILIAHDTGIAKKTVRNVLDSLSELAANHTTRKK
jgi:siroheme synthase